MNFLITEYHLLICNLIQKKFRTESCQNHDKLFNQFGIQIGLFIAVVVISICFKTSLVNFLFINLYYFLID